MKLYLSFFDRSFERNYSKPHSRNAFSLIEAAIVLAIIGVVIGGIWAAAVQVKQSHRRQEIATICGMMRQELYKSMANKTPSAPFYSNITPAIFPPDRISALPAGLAAITGRGQDDSAGYRGDFGLYYHVYMTNAPSDWPHYSVAGLNKSDCAWLGSHLSSYFNQMNMIFLDNPNGNYMNPAWGAANSCADNNNVITIRTFRDFI